MAFWKDWKQKKSGNAGEAECVHRTQLVELQAKYAELEQKYHDRNGEIRLRDDVIVYGFNLYERLRQIVVTRDNFTSDRILDLEDRLDRTQRALRVMQAEVAVLRGRERRLIEEGLRSQRVIGELKAKINALERAQKHIRSLCLRNAQKMNANSHTGHDGLMSLQEALHSNTLERSVPDLASSRFPEGHSPSTADARVSSTSRSIISRLPIDSFLIRTASSEPWTQTSRHSEHWHRRRNAIYIAPPPGPPASPTSPESRSPSLDEIAVTANAGSEASLLPIITNERVSPTTTTVIAQPYPSSRMSPTLFLYPGQAPASPAVAQLSNSPTSPTSFLYPRQAPVSPVMLPRAQSAMQLGRQKKVSVGRGLRDRVGGMLLVGSH